ncbi:MAG: ankyrin repeat domain-containing protein [bacterium]|nr:ankyrin repeat domain-containing protein [bacterium]
MIVMDQAAKAMGSKRCANGIRIPRKVLAFQQVAAKGERRLIEWFITHELVKVDSKDSNMNTALMMAAANGKCGVVGKLLESGADSNAANRFGHTALMMAAGNGHLGTVRILIEYNSKAHLKDREGKTAYVHAWKKGHYTVGRFIMQNQESLNKAAIDALKRGSAGELDYYICKGADPASLGPALDF